MSVRCTFLLVLFAWVPICLAQVSPFQPNVPQGGRAVAVAVSPAHSGEMLVASETGGLFRTTDGGTTWQHIDPATEFGSNDVAYAPTAPNVAIATGGADFMVQNNGFIWRTIDDGLTWVQPAGSLPQLSPTCPSRANAYGVSFEPGTQTVYVATDCGLAASDNGGATWKPVINVDPNVSGQNSVWSVEAGTGGTINVAAASGLYSSTNHGQTWTKAVAAPGFDGSNHSFASSPTFPSNVFFAGGTRRLWLSTDSGVHWSDLHAPAPPQVNRAPFVKIGNYVQFLWFNLFFFDVYWGNGWDLYRAPFLDLPSGPIQLGGWSQLAGSDPNYSNVDPADIGVDPQTEMPELLASDHGVHTTNDGGGTWTLNGGGSGGFDALQIDEVTGAFYPPIFPFFPPFQFLYYATQDNRIYASPDGGASWPDNVCSEGYSLQTEPTPQFLDFASPLTYAGPTCGIFLSGQLFSNVRGWPSSTDPNLTVQMAPYMLPTRDQFIQFYTDASGNAVFGLTLDDGTIWSPGFTVTEPVSGFPRVVGTSASPTVYEGVVHPGSLIGLVGVQNLLTPQAVVTPADVSGLGSLGIFPTMWAWYTVFGVDPNNPQHLLAPDIDAQGMKYSQDGGQNWFLDNALTNLVTDGGNFNFTLGEFPLVHVVAFDPYNSCHILVGMGQNGIIRTTDGGQSWTRVPGSAQIINLSDFYFPPSGDIIVSAYGRGLWRLSVDRTPQACNFESSASPPAPAPQAMDLKTGSETQFGENYRICEKCSYLVVSGGRILDVKLTGDRVSQVVISGGSLHEYDANRVEVPLRIPNSFSSADNVWPSIERLRRFRKNGTAVRALVVEESRLIGIIASASQLAFKPVRRPSVRLIGQPPFGGVTTVAPGGDIRIIGEGFLPTSKGGGKVEVRIGNRLCAENLTVDESGRFSASIVVTEAPGAYQVSVTQKESVRLSVEKVNLQVVAKD